MLTVMAYHVHTSGPALPFEALNKGGKNCF